MSANLISGDLIEICGVLKSPAEMDSDFLKSMVRHGKATPHGLARRRAHNRFSGLPITQRNVDGVLSHSDKPGDCPPTATSASRAAKLKTRILTANPC